MALNVGPAGIEWPTSVPAPPRRPRAPPALLVMGAGAQMISWLEGFRAELAGRGVQVIRSDRRDAAG